MVLTRSIAASLLCILGARGNDAAAADASSPVVSLTKDTWESTLKDKFVLVKFYAPWCGHCKAMAPDYIEAAKQLQKKGLDEVVLAEVDATVETDLAKEHEIQGYPTIVWFNKNGKKKEFSGGRTPDAIVEWVQKNMGPSLNKVTAEEAAKAVEARKWGEAVLVIQGDQSVESVAAEFADSEADVLMVKCLYVESSTKEAVVYRGNKEKTTYTGPEWTLEALKTWVSEQRVPLFGEINEENFEVYTAPAKNGLMWVCLDPTKLADQLEQYSPALVEAAGKLKEGETTAYPFVWLNIAEFEAHAQEELGCKDYPTLVLQKGDLLGEQEDSKIEKFHRSFANNTSLTADGVAQFFKDIESGALEPVPEPEEPEEDLDEEDEEEAEAEEAPKEDL